MLWILTVEKQPILIFNSPTINSAQHFAGSQELKRHLRRYRTGDIDKLDAKLSTVAEASRWHESLEGALISGQIHATWTSDNNIWTVPL
jgi:hypothetical protein